MTSTSSQEGSPKATKGFSASPVVLSGQHNSKTRLAFLEQEIAGATAEMNSADDPAGVFTAYQRLISLMAERKRLALEVAEMEVALPVDSLPQSCRLRRGPG